MVHRCVLFFAGRAEGAFNIATDEVTIPEEMEPDKFGNVADRPGKTDPACEVIARPEDRRHQEDEEGKSITHSELKAAEKD